MRKLKSITVLCLIGLSCVSCMKAIAQDEGEPTLMPEVISGEATTNQRLVLTLTLTHPDDLKVQMGDRVEAGQVLSDRTRDRDRLTARIEQLEIRTARLQQPIAGPPPIQPIPEVASLPPPSFLEEVAAVDRQTLNVEQAERNLMQQQRKLDLLQTFPSHELPEATIPHEQEQLAQRQRELDQAKADLTLAEAQLEEAKNERLYLEYRHSLEMSDRQLEIQQQQLQRQEQLQHQESAERDRSYQIAQLEAQQAQLEAQLLTLSTVRSPYNGTIQRLRWIGQTDQNLVVELTLAVDDDPSVSRPQLDGGGR